MHFKIAFAMLSGCAAVLIGGCSAQPAERASAPAVDAARIAADVRAAIRTQVDAYAARDPARAASILAPDIVTYFHGGPNVVGHAAATAAVKAQMADPAVALAVADETVDVAQAGDMAVYHATYRFTFTNPATGKPAVETGNWVAIFKRQADGTMKIANDIVADIPAPPTPAS